MRAPASVDSPRGNSGRPGLTSPLLSRPPKGKEGPEEEDGQEAAGKDQRGQIQRQERNRGVSAALLCLSLATRWH